MTEKAERPIPLPRDTRAFVCAQCGAVSQRPDGICQVQGRLIRGDWCGTNSIEPARGCENRIHNLRFKCEKCGRVAVESELLCEPEKMPEP